ncbi:hypothetical protein QVD99_001877 [Batrachochytrium dendrobatidis]|nr:hypothetical protein O5D80_000520 [Batrachochytrium dendrobatidis]KAK5672060.1 hypothetical protein QVD99_001877 [Batrachochytrium dendrobatidis]
MFVAVVLPVFLIVPFLLWALIVMHNTATKPLLLTHIPPVDSKQAVLLVTAHPDDECMFFSPTLLSLAKTTELYVLCLSTGNAQGLGRIREKELTASCKKLGISNASHVECIDHRKLPDSMTQEWDFDVILDHVASHILAKKIDAIITFDDYGVSGHTNHRAIYHAMKQGKYTGKISIPVYSLESVSVLRKFSFLLDVCCTYMANIWVKQSESNGAIVSLNNPTRHVFVANMKEYKAGREAMFEHASQLVWFRHLYLVFSRYMIVNTLKLVE